MTFSPLMETFHSTHEIEPPSRNSLDSALQRKKHSAAGTARHCKNGLIQRHLTLIKRPMGRNAASPADRSAADAKRKAREIGETRHAKNEAGDLDRLFADLLPNWP